VIEPVPAESLRVPLAQNGGFTANGVTYVRQ